MQRGRPCKKVETFTTELRRNSRHSDFTDDIALILDEIDESQTLLQIVAYAAKISDLKYLGSRVDASIKGIKIRKVHVSVACNKFSVFCTSG